MKNFNFTTDLISNLKSKSIKLSKSFIAVCLAFSLGPVLNPSMAYAKPGARIATVPKTAPKTTPKGNDSKPKDSTNNTKNNSDTNNAKTTESTKPIPAKPIKSHENFYPSSSSTYNYCSSSNFPWFYYWLIIHDNHTYDTNLNKSNEIYTISDMKYNKEKSGLFKTVYDITFTNGIKTFDTLERLQERLKTEDEIIYISIKGTNIGAGVKRSDLESWINSISNTKKQSKIYYK